MVSGRIDPLLLGASRRLQAESEAIASAVAHGGEAGRGRENVLQVELARLLPRRFAVETGSVLGSGSATSGQMDILICDRDNFPIFEYGSATGALVLPQSVYGAISVKTRLRPSDLANHFQEARELKSLVSNALGCPWDGLYGVFAYRLEGTRDGLFDAYHTALFNTVETGVDLIAAIGSGLCMNLRRFTGEAVAPAFLSDRSHVLGIQLMACGIETNDAFTDFYKVLLLALERLELNASLRGVGDLPSDINVSPLRELGFDAAFAGKSVDITLAPGMSAFFTIFYLNTGREEWLRGTESEVFLVAAGPTGYKSPVGWSDAWLSQDVYCSHTQTRVRPGEVGTFTFEVAVPAATAVGNYRLHARLYARKGGFVGSGSYANVVTVVTPERLAELTAGTQPPPGS